MATISVVEAVCATDGTGGAANGVAVEEDNVVPLWSKIKSAATSAKPPTMTTIFK
jgi:hypothetical protein